MHHGTMLRRKELNKKFENYTKNRDKRCPRCFQEAKQIKDTQFRCSWSGCQRTTFSVLRGTIFEKLRTKPYKIIRILELWLRKVPVGIIGYIVRVNPKVVERAIRFIKALVPKYYDSLERIGSPGSIIEIDESKFGKRKYHRGHPVEGVWVLDMVSVLPPEKLFWLPLMIELWKP